MKQYKTVTEKEMEELGYRFITAHYSKDQFDLLDRAVETLGTCKYLLVEVLGGIAIARVATEVDVLLEK